MPASTTDHGQRLLGRLQRWLHRHQTTLQSWVWVVGLSGALLAWLRVVQRSRGDFLNHWELGRRLVAGEFLYRGGLDYPYPPAWALVHAPWTVLPARAAEVLLWPIGLGFLGLLLAVLDRLGQNAAPLAPGQRFWAVAATLLLASRFLLRDAAEVWANTALVALSWLGIYLWTRRHDCLGGLSLGLATALKWTPALLIAFFLWKRELRMAVWAVVWTVLFSLLPAIVQGPEVTSAHLRHWLATVADGIAIADPSVGVLGEEPVRNLSLRPVLARWLMASDHDHSSDGNSSDGNSSDGNSLDGIADTAIGRALDLPGATAGGVIWLLILASLVFLAWTTRGRFRDRNVPATLYMFAGVSLLQLLLSPITWTQHAVAAVPALYWIARQIVAGGLVARERWLLGFFVLLVLVTNRTFVGRSFDLVLTVYGAKTWALVALLLVLLSLARRLEAATAPEP